MHGRHSLFIVATTFLLGACVAETPPLPNDTDAIQENCIEVEEGAWECEQGVAAEIRPGGVTEAGTAPENGGVEVQVYGRVYDPSGCYYCGQHSGQGLYDWAPCPWGQSIYRFHCVACNYYGNYDRILYDCGTPVIDKNPGTPVQEMPDDGPLEVSIEE